MPRASASSAITTSFRATGSARIRPERRRPRTAVGISINGSGNTIGGVAAGAANTIAFNTADGVQVTGGKDNPIRGNSIYANGGLGIELGTSGMPSQNVLGGSTYRPEPRRELPGAGLGGVCTGLGHDDRRRREHHAQHHGLRRPLRQPGAVLPAYGQGQIYLGATMVTTGVDGGAQFSFNDPALAKGAIISATVTDAAGNTSEFGLDFAEDNPPSAVEVARIGATAATTFNAGQTITFDASGSASPDAYPLTYSWDFGDRTVRHGTDRDPRLCV